VTSCAVSFLNCRSNLKDLSDAPVSSGVFVVRLSAPAASALTRTVIGSVSSAPPPRALTRIVDEPSVASEGTFTSSRTSPGLLGETATPSTTYPPPIRLADQPLGTPLIDSEMSAARVESTVRLKLTLLPGATATAGNGVVTSSPFAAPTVGAKTVRTRDEMTSAAIVGARRANLLSKVSLLDIRDMVGLLRRRLCQSRPRRYNHHTIQA
jgi:hypothetical protein